MITFTDTTGARVSIMRADGVTHFSVNREYENRSYHFELSPEGAKALRDALADSTEQPPRRGPTRSRRQAGQSAP